MVADCERLASLVTVFAKNERANLTQKEQAAAVELSKEIVSMWSRRQ